MPVYGGKRLRPSELPWLARFVNPKRFIYCGFAHHTMYFDNVTTHDDDSRDHTAKKGIELREKYGENAGVVRLSPAL